MVQRLRVTYSADCILHLRREHVRIGLQSAADSIHQTQQRSASRDCGYTHILVAVIRYALTSVVLRAIFQGNIYNGCKAMR